MNNKLYSVFFLALFCTTCNIYSQNEIHPGDIIITEIMQNPKAVSDTKGEWFELFNTSSSTIDLNNCKISDNGSNSHTIFKIGGFIIQPGQFMVLGNNDVSSENGNVDIDYKYSGFSLGNSDDEIKLFNEDETVLIDQVLYTGNNPWPDPDGSSMELIPQYINHIDNDDGNNWHEGTITYGDGDLGTPGMPNTGSENNDIIIIMQPESFTVCEGETILIQIRAEGSEFIEYLWMKDSEEISGINGPDLILNNAELFHSGEYHCVLSYNGNFIVSSSAIIEVIPLPIPDLGPDTIMTSRPDTIILDPGNFSHYTWHNGSTNRSFNNTEYGWKKVTVSDNSCISSDSVFIGQIMSFKQISSILEAV